MRTQRKRVQKKSGMKKPGMKIPRGVTSYNPSKTPWATRTHTTAVYAETLNLNLTASTTQQYVFRANSVYDPDQTGTGGSPIGESIYEKMYNRYLVSAVTYDVSFSPLKDDGNSRVSVAFLNGSNIPVNPDIFALANGKNDFVSRYTSTRFRGKFDLTKLNADPLRYRTDDRFSSNILSNPLEVMSIILTAFPTVDTAITVGVKLTYHVTYFDIDLPTVGLREGKVTRPLPEVLASGRKLRLERRKSC